MQRPALRPAAPAGVWLAAGAARPSNRFPPITAATTAADATNALRGAGGMKRRLSCAIAYIGAPSLVVLDEPTTGMDPYNRKFVWAMIEERKRGATTLLTTHSMEEADALGQEIAIMSHGQLVAFGSSMRLKRRFGAGYSLRLVTPSASAPALRANVQALLPDATLVDDSAGSLTFAVSEEAMRGSGPLLRYIESLQATNGGAPAPGNASLVSMTGAPLGGAYGVPAVVLNDWLITHTTLEEVGSLPLQLLPLAGAAAAAAAAAAAQLQSHSILGLPTLSKLTCLTPRPRSSSPPAPARAGIHPPSAHCRECRRWQCRWRQAGGARLLLPWAVLWLRRQRGGGQVRCGSRRARARRRARFHSRGSGELARS